MILYLYKKKGNDFVNVKIIVEMTQKEKDKLLSDYSEGWTIEDVVFEMIGPYDNYSENIEVKIIG